MVPDGPRLPKRKRRAELRFQRLNAIRLSLPSYRITGSALATSVVESNTPDGITFKDADTASGLKRTRPTPYMIESPGRQY